MHRCRSPAQARLSEVSSANEVLPFFTCLKFDQSQSSAQCGGGVDLPINLVCYQNMIALYAPWTFGSSTVDHKPSWYDSQKGKKTRLISYALTGCEENDFTEHHQTVSDVEKADHLVQVVAGSALLLTPGHALSTIWCPRYPLATNAPGLLHYHYL